MRKERRDNVVTGKRKDGKEVGREDNGRESVMIGEEH